jgi:integrase
MSDDKALARVEPAPLARAAQAADEAAARGVFARYRGDLAAETRRAQDADLARWARYLERVGVGDAGCSWAEDPECWRPVSWGLVEGFVKWQESEGFALSTVARALSTVRAYCKQAARAGAIAPDALRLIETVTAPKGKAARNRDAERAVTRRPGRGKGGAGAKKIEPVRLSSAQARQLKQQLDTPQGRRDALLMCLLLDHGLRVSEVADLQVTALDLAQGLLTFYRRKVDKEQTHRLSRDTLQAARRYVEAGDAPDVGPLLRQSDRQGGLTAAGMSTRGIAARVEALGERVGLLGLSPHDCRHYWATLAARSGTDPLALQEAGGWNSLAMPRRYVEDAAIANERVKLGEDRETP